MHNFGPEILFYCHLAEGQVPYEMACVFGNILIRSKANTNIGLKDTLEDKCEVFHKEVWGET